MAVNEKVFYSSVYGNHNYLNFLWNKNKKSGFNMDKIFLFIKINKISHANLYSQTSWQTNSHEMKREIAVCH